MFRICARLFRSFIGIPRRRPRRFGCDPGSATDWLPPVIGSDEWRLVLMADRGTDWYFDRR